MALYGLRARSETLLTQYFRAAPWARWVTTTTRLRVASDMATSSKHGVLVLKGLLEYVAEGKMDHPCSVISACVEDGRE